MGWKKTLTDVTCGYKDQNINFNDLVVMLQRIGFRHVRTTGSHRIFSNGKIILTLQPQNGKAKDYQVQQIRKALTHP